MPTERRSQCPHENSEDELGVVFAGKYELGPTICRWKWLSQPKTIESRFHVNHVQSSSNVQGLHAFPTPHVQHLSPPFSNQFRYFQLQTALLCRWLVTLVQATYLRWSPPPPAPQCSIGMKRPGPFLRLARPAQRWRSA